MSALEFLSGQVLRDSTGAPYTGAKASYWSDAGATTPLTVYSDAGLASAHTNPVVADGTTGIFPAIYIQARRYWRTVTTSADVSLPGYNIGPIDHSTLFASSAAPSPTYPYLRYHNTTDGNVYRRNAADSAWINEGGVDSLSNTASVTEQLTGTETGKSSTPDSVAGLWQRGTDIASASTLSLPATGGGVFNVTGTTTITGISTAQGGRTVKLRFASALTLTHNGTSFILKNNGANISVVSGDTAEFVNEAAADASGSNWRMFSFERASGSSLNFTDQLATQANMESASSTTTIVTPGRVGFHPGVAKCWGEFDFAGNIAASHNITSITDTAVGRITVTIATDFSSASWCSVSMMENTGGLCNSYQSKAAGSIELRSTNGNTAALQDSTAFDFAGFGDQ